VTSGMGATRPWKVSWAHHERVSGIWQPSQAADLGGLTGQQLLQERAAWAAQRPDLAPLAADHDGLADRQRAALQNNLRNNRSAS